MSFDLVLYCKKMAPAEGFADWFDEQLDVDGADEPDVIFSQSLKSAFLAIIEEFPPMNGPLAPSDDEINDDEALESRLVDYDIKPLMIYASIAWSMAEEATVTFYELAEEHGVGLYNPQSGDIIL